MKPNHNYVTKMRKVTAVKISQQNKRFLHQLLQFHFSQKRGKKEVVRSTGEEGLNTSL